MIGTDVCNCVWWFFDNGKLMNRINCSVMVLIPKVEDVGMIEQFRPISCSNFILKFITRIIASRLGDVTARVISKQQFRFAKGRRISKVSLWLRRESMFSINVLWGDEFL